MSYVDLERIEFAIKEIIKAIGEDPSKPNLKDTPRRVAKACLEFFDTSKRLENYRDSQIFNNYMNIDSANGSNTIIIKDIPIYSVCEHHLLPFHGVANLAYTLGNDKKTIGFSKICDLVSIYSKKLQLQERLTVQIAESIVKNIQPKGVFVTLKCEHLCVTMRNTYNSSSRIITNATRGNIEYNEIVNFIY